LREEFIKLCRISYDIDMKTENVLEVEPTMIDLIRLVKGYSEHRGLFIELFKHTFDSDIESPVYLFPFCMRELKFEEVKVYIIAWSEITYGTELFRKNMNFISDILHAFDDQVWEGDDFWTYYRA